MTATEQAKAYLATLAPHVRDRKAASVIRELVEENDRQRDLLSRAMVAIGTASIGKPLTYVEEDIRRVLE